MRIGFDNDKYLKIQSEHIKERIGKFGDKLYLEYSACLHEPKRESYWIVNIILLLPIFWYVRLS